MGGPYTPETLAERWGCSAETIRQMVKAGRLQGFRVGRMFRIPASAVEDHECQITGSDGSTAASSSHGSKQVSDGVSGLTPGRLARLKPRRAAL